MFRKRDTRNDAADLAERSGRSRKSDPSRQEYDEFESLEYEEDAFYARKTTTPSFDDSFVNSNDEPNNVTYWRSLNSEMDEIVVVGEEEEDGKEGKEASGVRLRDSLTNTVRPYLVKMRTNKRRFLSTFPKTGAAENDRREALDVSHDSRFLTGG